MEPITEQVRSTLSNLAVLYEVRSDDEDGFVKGTRETASSAVALGDWLREEVFLLFLDVSIFNSL